MVEQSYPREIIDPETGEIGMDCGPAVLSDAGVGALSNEGGIDVNEWLSVTGASFYEISIGSLKAFVSVGVCANVPLMVGFVRTNNTYMWIYPKGATGTSALFQWEGRVNNATKVRIAGVAAGDTVSYRIVEAARITGEQDEFTPSAVVQDDLGYVGLDDRVRQEVARRMAVLGFTEADKDAILDEETWKEDVERAEANMFAEADEEFGVSPYEEDLQGFVRVEREAVAERRERELEDERRLEELIRARQERERDEAAQLDVEREYGSRNSSQAIAARNATPPPSSPRDPERSDPAAGPAAGKGGKASSLGTKETPPKDRRS